MDGKAKFVSIRIVEEITGIGQATRRTYADAIAHLLVKESLFKLINSSNDDSQIRNISYMLESHLKRKWKTFLENQSTLILSLLPIVLYKHLFGTIVIAHIDRLSRFDKVKSGGTIEVLDDHQNKNLQSCISTVIAKWEK